MREQLVRECAKRIFDTIPDVKLIFLLRNPVNRTYSSYWMRRRKRKVYKNASFEEEISRRNNNYLTHGHYARQITDYLEFFPKEQLMFVISEELHTNTKVVLHDICSFIGVSPDFEFSPINEDVGSVPKNYFLTRAIKKMPKSGLRSILMNKLNIVKKYPPMSYKTREKLQEFFREPNKQLENIIERDLSEVWYK